MIATIHSIRPSVTELQLQAAMARVAASLADDLEGAGETFTTTSVAAAPVTLAAAFGDLCAVLGIAPPAFVQLAIG